MRGLALLDDLYTPLVHSYGTRENPSERQSTTTKPTFTCFESHLGWHTILVKQTVRGGGDTDLLLAIECVRCQGNVCVIEGQDLGPAGLLASKVHKGRALLDLEVGGDADGKLLLLLLLRCCCHVVSQEKRGSNVW